MAPPTATQLEFSNDKEQCMIFKDTNIAIKNRKRIVLKKSHLRNLGFSFSFTRHISWSEKLRSVKSCNNQKLFLKCMTFDTKIFRNLTTPSPNLKKIIDISTTLVYYYLSKLSNLPELITHLPLSNIVRIIPSRKNPRGELPHGKFPLFKLHRRKFFFGF